MIGKHVLRLGILLMCISLVIPYDVFAADENYITVEIESDSGINSDVYSSPTPVVLGDKLIVVWDDWDTGTKVSLVESDGTVGLMPSISISPRTNDNSDTIVYKLLSDGNILIYWYSSSSGKGFTDVYFKIVDISGTEIVGATKVNSEAGALNRSVDIAELSNGDIAFVWHTGVSTYALRRFNRDGSAVEASQILLDSVSDVEETQKSHNIAADKNGRFMIMCAYCNHEYRGMIFDNESLQPVKVGGQNSFFISDRGEIGDEVQYIKLLSNGKFLTVYRKSTGNDPTSRSIAFRIYNSDGTPYASETVIRPIHSWGSINEPIITDTGFTLSYVFDDLKNPVSYLESYDNSGSFQEDISSTLPTVNSEYGSAKPFKDVDGKTSILVSDNKDGRLDLDTWILRHEIVSNEVPVVSNVIAGGTAQVGETLTGSYDYSDVNGDLEGISTFKWYRYDDDNGNGKTEISGATAKTYKLTSDDLDKYVSLEVTPVAASGTTPGTTVESDVTSKVVAAEAAPVASNVSTSGTMQVGETLTGSYDYSDVNGDPEGTSIFKWYREDGLQGNKVEISGATTKTYELTSEDLNNYVRFEVTPVAQSGMSPGNAAKSPFSVTVQLAEEAPVASNVLISGTVRVGETLTGSYDYSDANGSLEESTTFKWYRYDDADKNGKSEISGATTKTYELTSDDLNKHVSFEVTPAAQVGISPGIAVESLLTSKVRPVETAPEASNVSTSGTAQVGQTLTGSYDYNDVNGDLEGNSTFKWYRYDDADKNGKTEISGATAKTYELTSDDLNKYVSFEVTPIAQVGISPGTAVESLLTSKVGVAEAAPVASNVTAGGTAQVGKTLSGSYDYSDVNGDLEGISTFKWYRYDDDKGNGKTEIGGATEKTYQLTSYDRDKYVSFEVTPVAASGTTPGTSVESEVTSKVVPAEAAPVASNVSTNGTAQVGQTFSGSYDYSDVNGDLEGISTFKWYRYDDDKGNGKTEIGGATEKTYQLTSNDLDKYVSFEVTPVAASGTTPGTAVESEVTAKVVPAEATPVASNVSTNGTAQVGKTLSGSYDYSDVNGDLEGISTFKWYRYDDDEGNGKAEIGGATAKTYQLTSDDRDKYVSFEVTSVAASGTTPGTSVESEVTAKVVPAEAAPVASNVSTNGTAQVGQTLVGGYSYSDANGDSEGTSTFKWYRYDDDKGNGKTEISGATEKTYQLTSDDRDKYVSFEVTPVAASGTTPGTSVESEVTAKVVPAEAAPVASNVTAGGTAQVGKTLSGSYDYSDANGDSEGTSIFKWYRYDDDKGNGKTEISGATTKTYQLTSNDRDKYVSFEVTPVASTGTTPGTSVESDITSKVAPRPTYSIDNIVDQIMEEKISGYKSGSQEIRKIAISKAGTGEVANLSVALSGANKDDFEITQPAIKTLDDEIRSTEITLKAKDGLAQGTYTAVVTVSADKIKDVSFEIKQVITPVPLSGECDITTVISPADSQKKGNEISADVENGISNMKVDVDVSDDASWKLYSDEQCKNEITDKNMDLNVGANTSYIRVTAEDGTSYKMYELKVKRLLPKDSSSPYIIESNPKNNQTNVSISTDIEIRFSENVYEGSKLELISLKKENSIVKCIYNVNGDKLNITPRYDLDRGSLYTLTIPEKSVTDAVYNPLENRFIIEFTTERILSNDAKLSKISLGNATLTPEFSPSILEYTSTVSKNTGSIDIEIDGSDEKAAISINGSDISGGKSTINLNVGENIIKIRVTAEDASVKTYVLRVTRKSSSSSSSGSSSSEDTKPEKETGTKVIVNGEEKTAGVEKVKEENGRKKVEVDIDSDAISKKIEEIVKKQQVTDEKTDNIIEIPVETKNSDSIKTILTGDIVKQMDQEEFKLCIETDEIDYIIPAKEVGIDDVARILGVESGSLVEIEVEVNIEKLDQDMKEEIEKKAEEQNYEVVFPPVEFKVVAKTSNTNGESNETEISKFKDYVERVVEIQEGVDPSKITTGILYNPDGTFSHVPTNVFEKDGKWFAKLNSLTNSSYSVIYNPVSVGAVEGHWSEKQVNDMVSRLVIKNPENFMPDRAITRGEFAEYITKAVGIYRTEIEIDERFTDVKNTNKFANAIHIAFDYGIIKGYEDASFRPDSDISRQEAMVMYSRAMDIVKLEASDSDRINNYSDKEKVAKWAYGFVQKAIGSKVFNGRSDEVIDPEGKLTCAEAATAMRNLLIESELIND